MFIELEFNVHEGVSKKYKRLVNINDISCIDQKDKVINFTNGIGRQLSNNGFRNLMRYITDHNLEVH